MDRCGMGSAQAWTKRENEDGRGCTGTTSTAVVPQEYKVGRLLAKLADAKQCRRRPPGHRTSCSCSFQLTHIFLQLSHICKQRCHIVVQLFLRHCLVVAAPFLADPVSVAALLLAGPVSVTHVPEEVANNNATCRKEESQKRPYHERKGCPRKPSQVCSEEATATIAAAARVAAAAPSAAAPAATAGRASAAGRDSAAGRNSAARGLAVTGGLCQHPGAPTGSHSRAAAAARRQNTADSLHGKGCSHEHTRLKEHDEKKEM